MSEPQQVDPVELDTKGLLCPMPVIRTQDKIKQMEPGQRLLVQATDPGTCHDIPAWCRVHGHQIVDQSEQAQIFYFEILVGE